MPLLSFASHLPEEGPKQQKETKQHGPPTRSVSFPTANAVADIVFFFLFPFVWQITSSKGSLASGIEKLDVTANFYAMAEATRRRASS